MATELQHSGRYVSPKRRPLQHPVTAWIVLVVCCTATFIGWSVSKSQMVDRDYEMFQSRTSLVTKEIERRIDDLQSLLAAARAFQVADYPAKRSAWKNFVEQLNLGKSYPGVDGVGFISCVVRENLPAFTETTRADGVPEFVVHPQSSQPESFVVKYIEPIENNRKVLG